MSSLRDRERESIRAFLAGHRTVFHGAVVVDVGSGRQPYRELIEDAGGFYVPYDSPDWPASVAEEDTSGSIPDVRSWPSPNMPRVIVCTQVIQYVQDPPSFCEWLYRNLCRTPNQYGTLLMTGPTNWPIVERDDLWRMTAAGATELLSEAGFSEIACDYRHSTRIDGEEYPHGWAAVARA